MALNGMNCRCLLLVILCAPLTNTFTPFYGHNLTERSTYMRDVLLSSWILADVPLGWGFLQSFLVYVPYIDSDVTPKITLQLWTAVPDIEHEEFSLKWTKDVEFTNGTGRLYEIQVGGTMPLTEVSELDRIGFTSLHGNIPIACDMVDDEALEHGGHRVLLYELFSGDPPQEGVTYVFSHKHGITAEFSVAILLQPVPGTLPEGIFVGNDIKYRPRLIRTGASRSWIDDDIVLVPGRLSILYLYAGKMENSTAISLQIYSPGGETLKTRVFTLIWEKRVVILPGEPRYLEVVMDPTQSPLLTSEDKLGWTFETDAGPLCYSFNPQHSTLQYAWAEEGGGPPRVGHQYGFDKLQRPMEFSVAAMIVDEVFTSVASPHEPHVPKTNFALSATERPFLGECFYKYTVINIGLAVCTLQYHFR